MYESSIKSSLENPKIIQIETQGKIPSPRFGHSFTILNSQIGVLFGGAKGNLKSYHFDLNQSYFYIS